MRLRRVEKGAIGEDEASCDVCGKVDRLERFASIYLGEHGEKMDLCEKCFREYVRIVRGG
ncbi:MAG: hypothetical protein QW328_08055 [Nitrososphaerota archaeon]